MSSSETSGRDPSAAPTTSSPARHLRDDLDIGLQPQETGEGAAHHRLILGEQDPDHRAGTGKLTANLNPPSGRLLASSRPWRCSTRSLSPSMPCPD